MTKRSRRAKGKRSWSWDRSTDGRGTNSSRRRSSNRLRRRRSDGGWNRIKNGNCNGMHYGFLPDNHRGAVGRVIEKRLGHSRGEANATMGGGVGRDVSLVHRIAAAEKHRVGHARAIVMAAGRFTVLAGIDVRFHNGAEIVHVIAENSGDVLLVLPNHAVMAGRRPEARFPGGNGRFADEIFAFVEIGALFGDADDDLRRAGDAIAIPIPGGWGGSSRCRSGGVRRFHFRATGE